VGRWTFVYDAHGNTAEVAVQSDDGSGPWENDERTLYSWDAADRLTEIVQQRGDGAGGWSNRRRDLYTYDAAGNRSVQLFQFWDADADAWVDGDRNTYAYDALGQVIRDTQERWSAETEAWGGIAEWVYGYDAQGRQQERIRRVWEASDNAFRNNSRRFISRFIGQHPVEFIDQVWVGGGWQGSVRHVAVGDGFTIRIDRFLSSDWAPTWRRELSAGGDRLTEEQFLTYSAGPTDKIDRLTLAYDADGRVAAGSLFDADGEAWRLQEQFSCVRDGAGRIAEQEAFIIDTFNSVTYGNREAFTYATDGVLAEILGQEWTGGTWVNEYRGVAFDLSTSAEAPPEASALSLTVAPNPSSGSARLGLTTATGGDVRVTVFDALGRRVAEVAPGAVAAGATEVSLPLEGLPPGVYVVQAAVGGRVATARMTVGR
jgi:hypothetical protein